MFGPDPTSTARRRYPAARSTTPLTRSNTQRAADTYTSAKRSVP